jgi:methanogenic corrinoid protein MtbC1
MIDMHATAPALSASQSVHARRAELAQAIVARHYARQPSVWARYGDAGREKSIRDTGWHLSYLEEALAAGEPSLFVEYVAWSQSLFEGLKLPPGTLAMTLACARETLQQMLAPEDSAAAAAYIDAALAHLRAGPEPQRSLLDGESALAGRYLGHLIQGDRNAASQLVLDAVRGGISVKDIYLRVFQPAQREVGRLWQSNDLSVAQEHFCTAATQMIMSQLYPFIFNSEKNGRRMVATCVGGELHEIGLRMVADFFEMDGWDTYYLGANAPAEAIAQSIADRRADMLAISATMTFHVARTAELIQAVRDTPAGRGVSILVGGYPFNLSPQLWRQVGADGSARNAQEAIEVANGLVLDAGGAR